MERLPNPVKVDHRNRDKAEPHIWLVATDRCMSGWGLAPNKSYVAYPTYSYEDRKEGMAWMKERGDFIRVRENLSLPRIGKGDHLSIYDRGWVDQPRKVTGIYTVEIVENRRYNYILQVDDGIRGYDIFLQVNDSRAWEGFTRLDALPDNAEPSDWVLLPTWTRRFILSAYDLGLIA